MILAKKLDVFVIIYLDDILIYIKYKSQGHINIVCWMLDKLRKHGLYAKFKKCCYYKDEVCFLKYIVSAQKIQIKDTRIKVVRN